MELKTIRCICHWVEVWLSIANGQLLKIRNKPKNNHSINSKSNNFGKSPLKKMSHHSHDHHHKKRVLFLLKENSYGNFGIAKSGLLNSVRLLVKALEQFVEEFKISVCVDANNIDKEVWLLKLQHCFIEAIWVTGKKLAEIKRLHPKVIFIIRIHSNIPFLAMEGSAIERLKEYNELQGVFISFNGKFTNDFRWLFIPIYLPNLYIDSNIMTCIEEKNMSI